MSSTLSAPAVQAVRAQRTALVVDDVEDMLDLLGIALHLADFKVLRASSASDALNLFEAHADKIDLLMTDVRVASDSGIDLAKRLLARKPSLHVLATSGFAMEGKGQLHSKSGIDFLPKPFSTSELRTKLRSIFAANTCQLTVTIADDGHGQHTLSTTCTQCSSDGLIRRDLN